jgi:diadenosine tetraphosphate (Ap4A) HIT family hydrolase
VSAQDPLVIRQSAHWLWRVHTNQAHLGHMVFIARRETQGSLADCTAQEWSDLQAQIALFESLTRNLFAPDRFNYTQFGNEWAQLHVHGFPRYRSGADWEGRRFPDPQWGKAPIPEPPSPLEGAELEKFAAWLAEKLRETGQ